MTYELISNASYEIYCTSLFARFIPTSAPDVEMLYTNQRLNALSDTSSETQVFMYAVTRDKHVKRRYNFGPDSSKLVNATTG